MCIRDSVVAVLVLGIGREIYRRVVEHGVFGNRGSGLGLGGREMCIRDRDTTAAATTAFPEDAPMLRNDGAPRRYYIRDINIRGVKSVSYTHLSGSSWTGRCAAKAGRCWSFSTSSGRRAVPCPMRGGRGLRRSEPSGFPAGRLSGRAVVRRKRAGVPFRTVPGRPLSVAALVRPLRLPLLSFVKKNCTVV